MALREFRKQHKISMVCPSPIGKLQSSSFSFFNKVGTYILGSTMVFFRFEMPSKDYYEDPILSNPVDIEQDHLDAKPASLMSVLAQKRWQEGEDKANGETSDDAIIIDIDSSPCQGAWSRSFAEWIPKIYVQNAGGGDGIVAGIPPDVELEDAWAVLDYLGLSPDNPKDIDMSESKKIVQIRAKLYLRYMNDMAGAKDYIFESFLDNPTNEKLFVFVSSAHDFDFIVRENYTGTSPVERLGKSNDLDKTLEWASQKKLRGHFLDELKLEGFEARYLHRLEFSSAAEQYVEGYSFEGSAGYYTECHSCRNCGHYARECPASNPKYIVKYTGIPKDMCWAFDSKSGTLGIRKMIVLSVIVPPK